MTRRIDFSPAFDRRHDDPKKNYGIHGVEMRWYLIGDKGAVQFVVFTNWMLPEVQTEIDYKPVTSGGGRHTLHKPMPADVGYHTLEPQYEGQEPYGECNLLDGKVCYYDGSGLAAEPMFEKLLRGGHEAVWAEMEKLYRVYIDADASESD